MARRDLDIKAACKKIETKTKLLEFISDETKEILETRDSTAIRRQLNIYGTRIEEILELKTIIQEAKIDEDNDPEEIRAWSSSIDKNVKEFNPIMAEMKAALKEIKEQEQSEEEKQFLFTKQKQLEVENKMEREKLEQKLKFERKLEEMKTAVSNEQSSKVKLPKLIITKFQGTNLDWFRFWNQYEAEIDKAKIDSVTKFSYLKELLVPKFRAKIEGLPFTPEGYERAKNILKTTYGKITEVVNAYIQNITSLPTIKGGNAVKIHEFYGKLLTSVQALESLGKLKEINGFARATLDKLEGIRSDWYVLTRNGRIGAFQSF